MKPEDSQVSEPGSKAASAKEAASEVDDEPEHYELHEAVCTSLYDMPPPSQEGASGSEGEDEEDLHGKVSASAGTFKERLSKRLGFLTGHTTADPGACDSSKRLLACPSAARHGSDDRKQRAPSESAGCL